MVTPASTHDVRVMRSGRQAGSVGACQICGSSVLSSASRWLRSSASCSRAWRSLVTSRSAGSTPTWPGRLWGRRLVHFECAPRLRWLRSFDDQRGKIATVVEDVVGHHEQRYARADEPSSRGSRPTGDLIRGLRVSQEGFEPTTKGLRVPCSTAELLAHLILVASRAHEKRDRSRVH